MFEGTHSAVRAIFAQHLKEESFEKDSVVCRQTNMGGKLYIIDTGNVEFFIDSMPVGDQASGGVFGELSLVYGIERSATAVCLTNCVLWSLTQEDFRKIQSRLNMEALDNSYRQAQRTLSGLACEVLLERLEYKQSGIMLENLHSVSLLGRGTFGTVSLVRDKKSKKTFALKKLGKTNLVKAKQGSRVIAERNILMQCHSPFVIKLHATYQDDDSLYFLTEFVQGGDLMAYMIEQGR